ncbi:hypothetical protein EVAR_26946_1 [Eumeta japonica]|uniref:Uncharacterized protein n=1 Tax=Eumeta variegata TaxID=151549 RepID=A0A4C1VKX9_EUMVA|nr:hypothetical protein EVAR_26946_1 [Eumeta japonica]
MWKRPLSFRGGARARRSFRSPIGGNPLRFRRRSISWIEARNLYSAAATRRPYGYAMPPINWNSFGVSVAVVLQQAYVKLVLNKEVENSRCPSFLPTPQGNRSPRGLKDKYEVLTYATMEKSP